jgi:hypothetical protein
MKKLIVLLILCACAVAVCACSDNTKVNVTEGGEFRIVCAAKSGEYDYVVTYADDKIVSESGAFILENMNDFDIIVHVAAAGGTELTAATEAGGKAVIYRVEPEAAYTVGCHADVDEGVEIVFNIKGSGEWVLWYTEHAARM